MNKKELVRGSSPDGVRRETEVLSDSFTQSLDSTWWMPNDIYQEYRLGVQFDRTAQADPYFKVKYCVKCRVCFEFAYDQNFKCMMINYYEDFPSISCEREHCPKCK